MALAKHKNVGIEKLVKLPIVGEQPKDEKEEKFLREVCEYEFSNVEEPGLMVTFPYGDTRNSANITLMHGGKYKLPRFIARHLDTRTTPIWKWRPDGTGSMHKELVGTSSRFQLRQVYAR